jgi:hypothetical protein
MVKKIFRNISMALALLAIEKQTVESCGWFEYAETYRISVFKAEISGMQSYRPFFYTPELMYAGYSPERNSDWQANCGEWKKNLGNKPELNDIYAILYQASPDMFLLAASDSTLHKTFEGNTFVETLLMHQNIEWLQYLIFAKQNEFNNFFIENPWHGGTSRPGPLQQQLMENALKRIENTKNQLLQERYAYQLIRLYRQAGMNLETIELYKRFFENSKSIVLQNWAMLHYAEALLSYGKYAEANYKFSLVFNNSAEKRVRAFKLSDKNWLAKALNLAKNNNEKAGIWAMLALYNPGPALKQIQKVYENNPVHHTMPLLVMREINKLEDWIFTPVMTNHQPSFHPEIEQWVEPDEMGSILAINRKKDLQYLEQLKSFLELAHKKLATGLYDYIWLARGHLSLMAGKNSEALSLFGHIPKYANPSVLMQKDIALALYYCFERKEGEGKIKEELGKILVGLEKTASSNNDYLKALHSLCGIISRAYQSNGDMATAALLKLKAEAYKNKYESNRMEWYYNSFDTNTDGYNDTYYWYLAYLDRYAKPGDIDNLIGLTEKKSKNQFEQFLCSQPLPAKAALLDLKGTLALRQGDIKAASLAFSAIPSDYWEKVYEFSNYLKADPFLPPNSQGYHSPYKFNKANVTKQLADLLDEAAKSPSKAAGNYIKAGHFYYNASYWGNSWMMLSYSKTSSPAQNWSGFYHYDILFGDINTLANGYVENYYQLKLARNFYTKAYKSNPDKEQQAIIAFMGYCCHYSNFLWENLQKGWDEQIKPYQPDFLADLYKNFSNTKTFKELRCPLMDDFAMQLGVWE